MTTNRLFRLAAIIVLAAIQVGTARAQKYVLVGWNDLGMHCSNQDFAKIAVLPPFNNVTAQLIEDDSSGLPRLVTSGFTVEYSIPGNTTSAGKTNFWEYAQQLFGLGSPLPQDVGLTGNGLTGVLTASGNHFTVTGIPVTPYQDSDLVHESPFQLIHLVAKRTSDGTVVATTDAVIPVSNEVGCVQSGCHSSETAILNAHPGVSGFSRTGPVLCASCHASNALGTTGIPEAKPFSFRMHDQHREVAGPANSIATCYKCHPGPNTQCLRDVMGRNPVNPLVCQDCHGTMDTLALSIDAGRRPWLDEPRCGGCHGAGYAEQSGKLFRQSAGHGGLMCSACHGSPHAIQPTVQPNDNMQNVRLQGYAGTLGKCSVCHWTHQSSPGPHGIMDTTVVTPPETPAPVSPPDGVAGVTAQPTLRWQTAAGAWGYDVEVAADALFAGVVWSQSAVSPPTVTVPALAGGATYYWHVRARNPAGTSLWAPTWSFTTATGVTASYQVRKYWNIVSTPVVAENPAAVALFPSAVSPAYAFSPASGYVAGDSLASGAGYWLRFGADQSVSITGVPSAVETVAVAAGWNLIGSVHDPVPWGAVTANPPGIVQSRPFAYDGAYQLADTLFPARGYWVKADGPGTLVISSAGQVPGSAPVAFADGDPLALRSTTLTFTDAAGRSGTLLVIDGVAGAGATGRYAMPPLPPKGGFDVRFDSETMAASPSARASGRAGIRVTSARYPLTVTWGAPARPGAFFLEIDGTPVPVDAEGSVSIPSAAALSVVAAGPVRPVPAGYALEQNTPNPFNPSTDISYTVPGESRVNVSVYDMLGATVATLVDEVRPAGTWSVRWEGGERPAGVYFYRLEATDVLDPAKSVSLSRKMLYLK